MPWVSIVNSGLGLLFLGLAHESDNPGWSTYLVAIAGLDFTMVIFQ